MPLHYDWLHSISLTRDTGLSAVGRASHQDQMLLNRAPITLGMNEIAVADVGTWYRSLATATFTTVTVP